MDMREIVEQLLQGDAQHVRELTKGCGSCRRFIHRLRRKPRLRAGWEDVPPALLEREATRMHQRLFLY